MTERDRELISVSGSDRRAFLQGLVTNDVAKLDDGLVYAALLTPQGKYLADFLMLEQDQTIHLDVKATLAEDLIRRLSMYRLRADVAIRPSDRNVRCGTGPRPEGAFSDPRHPALGWRDYASGEGGDDGTDRDAIRVAHCIPETGVELTPDTFILEAGFERLNGVDFHKGCYVGQEVTVRMKHKTELRKGLVTVSVEGSAPVGSEIVCDGKPAGRIFTQSGGRAIAYLRFARARGDLHAGGAIVRWSG